MLTLLLGNDTRKTLRALELMYDLNPDMLHVPWPELQNISREISVKNGLDPDLAIPLPLHLQVKATSRLVTLAQTSDVCCATYSEIVYFAFRLAVKENRLQPINCKFYMTDAFNGTFQSLAQLQVNHDGRVHDWPDNSIYPFEELDHLLSKLL